MILKTCRVVYGLSGLVDWFLIHVCLQLGSLADPPLNIHITVHCTDALGQNKWVTEEESLKPRTSENKTGSLKKAHFNVIYTHMCYKIKRVITQAPTKEHLYCHARYVSSRARPGWPRSPAENHPARFSERQPPAAGGVTHFCSAHTGWSPREQWCL